MDHATPSDKKKVRIRRKVKNPEVVEDERWTRIYGVAKTVAWAAVIVFFAYFMYSVLDSVFTPRRVGL